MSNKHLSVSMRVYLLSLFPPRPHALACGILKRAARKTTQTIYQLKQSLLDDYMRQQLSNPSIIFKNA